MTATEWQTKPLGEVFTEGQLKQARDIYRLYDRPSKPCVDHLREEITGPLIKQIDERPGQENGPAYWAWVLAYDLGKDEA